MIRHLRWKVVATNMLLISLVLLAVFAAVFFISRDNYRKNVRQQLYQALEQGDYALNQPGADSIPCFVAEVYGSGTVRVAGNSYYDLSDETKLAQIVTAAGCEMVIANGSKPQLLYDIAAGKNVGTRFLAKEQ